VLPCPEADLRAALDAFMAAVLLDMASAAEHGLEAAREWERDTRAALTEALDSQLWALRPRAGLVEEESRRARSTELLAQARQVERFVRGQAKRLQQQVCA
jgi:hypothetical protein